MKIVHSETLASALVNLKVSDDQMKLFADVQPSAAGLTKDQLIQVIRKVTTVAELHDDVIAEIVADANRLKATEQRRVARGKDAEPGIDGKVLYLVRRFSGQVAVGGGDGLKNLKELSLFENVRKGQPIARIYPPKPGVDGFSALGKAIRSAPGKPCKAKFDSKSVTIEGAKGEAQPYELLLAATDGFMSDVNNTIAINGELTVKGDLDYSYGNIDFVGSVTVTGDVQPGFEIRAAHGIVVNGMVRGGTLVTMSGDIVVKGAVFGGANSRILSGKGLQALSLQEVNAEITGPIVIRREIRDSLIRSQASVTVKEGALFGGESFAVCGVEAADVGSAAGKTTTIHLCRDVEATIEYQRLVKDIAAHDQAEKLLELHLGPLKDNPSRISLLAPTHRDRMSQFTKKLAAVRASKAELLSRQTDMLKGSQINHVLRVNFNKHLRAGVVVVAGEHRHQVIDDLPGPGTLEFLPDSATWKRGPLVALECSVGADAKSTKSIPNGKNV